MTSRILLHSRGMVNVGWIMMRFLSVVVLLFTLAAHAQDRSRPFPCRVNDSNSPDILITTLGEVQTPLAQGWFDPEADRVVLKSGEILDQYYSSRLGINYYQPPEGRLPETAPAGWTTWQGYKQSITDSIVFANMTWLHENLQQYGLKYILIDDGWEYTYHVWKPNEKFHNSFDHLMSYADSLGLELGIWLVPQGHGDPDLTWKYPSYLRDDDGKPVNNSCCGAYMMDISTPGGLGYIEDLGRQVRDWGFTFLKIDAQPSAYNEYKQLARFMRRKDLDIDSLFRESLKALRRGTGPDMYISASWQTGGAIDGIIGKAQYNAVDVLSSNRVTWDISHQWYDAGIQLNGLMKHLYQNAIVWYADLDAIMVQEPFTIDQARFMASLFGLTGVPFIIGDRAVDITPDRVDILRRILPTTPVKPFDLFKSERMKHVIDLKVNHLGRNYDVVGFFNWYHPSLWPYKDKISIKVTLNRLGLEKTEYHAFDYWNQVYLGIVRNKLDLTLPRASCRVITLVPAENRPQLISTNRHITQGWVDLKELNYDSTSLTFTGISEVVAGESYMLHFAWKSKQLSNFYVVGADVENSQGQVDVTVNEHARTNSASVRLLSSYSGTVSWKVEFGKSILVASDKYVVPSRSYCVIYPNPVSAGYSINVAYSIHAADGTRKPIPGSGIDFIIDLRDATGRRITVLTRGTTTPGSHLESISLPTLVPGLYYVHFKTPVSNWSLPLAIVK